jgi:hypothetical protein
MASWVRRTRTESTAADADPGESFLAAVRSGRAALRSTADWFRPPLSTAIPSGTQDETDGDVPDEAEVKFRVQRNFVTAGDHGMSPARRMDQDEFVERRATHP